MKLIKIQLLPFLFDTKQEPDGHATRLTALLLIGSAQAVVKLELQS